MRRALSVVHRWFGVFSASFLFVAGLTGAIIAWDHELDAWLNPELFRAPGSHAAGAEQAEDAVGRGISAPPGALFYAPELALYGVGFFAPGHGHGDGGLGNPWLYLDAQNGRLLGAQIPGTGSAGDLFMQAQFPLHSGRTLGVFGRALVSLLGLVVALLSVTGVLLWARRLRARNAKMLRFEKEGLAAGPDASGC